MYEKFAGLMLSVSVVFLFSACGDKKDDCYCIPPNAFYSVCVTVANETDVFVGTETYGSYFNNAADPVPAQSTLINASGGDGSYGMLLTFKGQAIGNYTVETDDATLSYTSPEGQTYGAGSVLGFTNGTVEVTYYGAVGGYISGSFDITASVFNGPGPAADTEAVTGIFDVQREQDDFQ